MAELYPFTYSYRALKLLGKTLYNNPFAAFSELIANGFDADADRVYVYIDARNMSDARVEIIDNGVGMSNDFIRDIYTSIGRDNRGDSQTKMGRKGIGKLAAFYLSDYYHIVTKTNKDDQIICLADFKSFENGNIDTQPGLQLIEKIELFENRHFFDTFDHGTAIVLEGVKFKGYGKDVFEAFSASLSELFVFDQHSAANVKPNKRILCKVVLDEDDINKNYSPVNRYVAYGNMTDILVVNDSDLFKNLSSECGSLKETEFDDKEKPTQQVVKLFKNDKFSLDIERLGLHGWVGIHHTRKKSLAKANDHVFTSSSFYSPFKIRLYIRGKCAVTNLIPYLKSASQMTYNYLEGELFCDSLDANDQPDIASSSRQSIDMNDERVVKLMEITYAITRSLSDSWQKRFKNDKERTKKRQQSAAKKAVDDLSRDLGDYVGTTLTTESAKSMADQFSAAIQRDNADFSLKTVFSVFLSHRRTEKYFADFLYYYLVDAAHFPSEWIFYSSKPGGIEETTKALETQIRESICNENTLAVFCVSGKGFKQSEYTLFESGAAWAIKQQSCIGLGFSNYDDVPHYFEGMKKCKAQISSSSIDRDSYVALVKLLNMLIAHLNYNYLEEIDKKPLIDLSSLPNEVFFKEHPEDSIDNYFDKDVVRYWNAYINEGFSKLSNDEFKKGLSNENKENLWKTISESMNNSGIFVFEAFTDSDGMIGAKPYKQNGEDK